jgi:DNA repair protein RadC
MGTYLSHYRQWVRDFYRFLVTAVYYIMDKNPHYIGHRDRLRQRFLSESPLADYELLELLLFQGNPRRDTKPVAKKLLEIFGSLERVLSADTLALEKVGLNPASTTTLKLVYQLHVKLLQHAMFKRDSLDTFDKIIQYCHRRLAPMDVEVFHVVYLDTQYGVIRDVTHQSGTVNQVTVYPRNIMKEALNCGAAKIILAHNHPGGNPKPSFEDLALTQKIIELAKALDIVVVDHIIIGHMETVSLKALGHIAQSP